MKHDTRLSLSLQKEIERRNLALDSEMQKTLRALKISALLSRCGIVKQRGYVAIALFVLAPPPSLRGEAFKRPLV